MKIKDIYEYLDSISPFELQEKWDNSGLIVGSMNDEFKNVYITLDLDKEYLKKVKKGALIITHHPLIFKGLKTINDDTYSSKILRILIKRDIKLISMHTNIDKSHLNKYIMKDILCFEITNKNDFLISAKIDMKFKKFKKLIKEKLYLSFNKSVKCHKKIKTFYMFMTFYTFGKF